MKKDLLTTNDFSREEILVLFEKATALKVKRKKGIEHLPLKGKSLGIFSINIPPAPAFPLKLE
tara:strand:- start:5 stop:193 length:189 start_codon:yes stop_codon:yes gene_type:complete